MNVRQEQPREAVLHQELCRGPDIPKTLRFCPSLAHPINPPTRRATTSSCARLGLGQDIGKCQPAFHRPFPLPAALPENTTAIAVVVLSTLVLCALVGIAIYLYKRRRSSERGAFESARYSRTTSNPSEAAEKNILVSDMEMNEQQD